MITQQRKHDAATNNIANLNTPGFKQNTVVQRSFPEMLISLMRGGEDQPTRTIGSLHTGVFAEESVPLFAQGDLMETSQMTDLAIVSNIQVDGLVFDANGRAVNAEGEIVYQPQAFFTVVNGDGELRYTRDGRFTVNEAGEWLAAGGHRLVGTDGQPIVLDDLTRNVQVTRDGLLIDADTGEELLGADGEPLALQISVIDNPHMLIREGEGVFMLAEDAAPARAPLPGEGVTVLQGYIERSNVDIAAVTVNMMAALRAYEANQKVIQFYDRSLEKAVNEVGRV